MQLNKANFLTWFNSASDSNSPLPIPYAKTCSYPSVAWLIQENMSFIINGFNIGFNPTYTLYICNLDKYVIATVGNCDLIEVSTGYRLYANLTCPNVQTGDYILKISNGTVTYYSNPIAIIDSTSLWNTAIFKFRHKFDKNSIEYTISPLDSFYQQFRLFCGFGDVNSITSKEIINDIDSSTPREYNTIVSVGYKCNIFGLDMDRHQAVIDMITSSYLEINGIRFQSDSSYSASPIGKSGISKGSFNVQDYSLRYARR